MHLVINKWTVGPILLTVGLLIWTFTKVAIEKSWVDHLETLVFVLIGGLTVLFTDEMVEHLKEYDLDEGWLTHSPKYAKLGGLIMLLVSSNMILDIV